MFVELLTRELQPPPWSGPATQYMKLSDGDEPQPEAKPEPKRRTISHQHRDESMRTCKQCDTDLPATPEFFFRNKRERMGINYTCKLCSKKWWKNRP